MLTNKKKMFVEHYLQHFNATRAAIEAGYSERSAGTQGYDLLKDPDCSELIHARMKQVAMDADEVLFHLREIALGIRAELTDAQGNIDLIKVAQANKTHLIKSIRSRSITGENSDIFESEIQTQDRIKALELIGKHHKMFTDRTEILNDLTWKIELTQLGVNPAEIENELSRQFEQYIRERATSVDTERATESEDESGASDVISLAAGYSIERSEI